MSNDTNDITENQCLDLSALVSNRVEYLTGQPISESDDCSLAIKIAEWAREVGFNVISSSEVEPLDTAAIEHAGVVSREAAVVAHLRAQGLIP